MFCTDTETRKARRQHVCTWCSEPILPGSTYRRWATVDDGWSTSKMHPACDDQCAHVLRDEPDNTYTPGEGAEPEIIRDRESSARPAPASL